MSNAVARVAVITVNWNRSGLTKQSFRSLASTEGIDWHLFVVDNGSTDDSARELSGLGAKATLIEAGVNSGWAGGNNRGIAAAAAQGFDWFFLLNNDAIVEPSTLRALWECAAADAAKPPVVGAVQVDDDPASCYYGCAEKPNSVFADNFSADDFRQKGDVYETSSVKGAALFFHRSHLENVGLFDERYFLNYEEIDWCKRARKAGYRLLMDKRAVVHHGGSGSMGGMSSPMSTYFLVRNAMLYAETHGGAVGVKEALSINLSWARANHGTASSIRAVVRALRSKGVWATAWKAGIRDYALRRFGDCPDVVRRLTYQT